MTNREVVITAANTVELVESPLDINLGRSDVLIETEASYISAGTELANYTGLEPQTREPGSWCAYPWRPGYANVGHVLRTGQGVDRVKEEIESSPLESTTRTSSSTSQLRMPRL